MKPEWGTKRACRKCAEHFYDLQRAFFDCPKCNTSYKAEDFLAKPGRESARKDNRKKAEKTIIIDEIDVIDVELDTDIETDDLIEDTSDLIDDEDVPEVIERETEEDL